PPRMIEVDRPVEVGRECGGVVVSDPGVSRRHLRLAPVGDALVVRDLGSRNGTKVDGAVISEETTLHAGNVVTIGSVEIVVTTRRGTTHTATVPPSPVPSPPVSPEGAPSAVARPALDELASLITDAAVVRFRTGS